MTRDSAERMLDNALETYAALLTDAASYSLSALTFMDDVDVSRALPDGEVPAPGAYDQSPDALFFSILQAQDALKAAEAVLATILNRSGVSWDALAGTRGSRQAIHKRLAKLGEWYLAHDYTRRGLDRNLEWLADWSKVYPNKRAVDPTLHGTVDALMVVRGVPTWWRNKFRRRRRRRRRRR